MNNQTINELLKIAGNACSEPYDYQGQLVARVGSGVDDYFDNVVWSIEKEEWDKMCFAEKYGFVEVLIKQVK